MLSVVAASMPCAQSLPFGGIEGLNQGNCVLRQRVSTCKERESVMQITDVSARTRNCGSDRNKIL